MAEREPVEVTVEINGRELVAGTLWVHERGGQTALFRYSDSYLTSPGSYSLDPVLPKAAGVFHTPPDLAMFNAFADSAPDRWGENLMRREERERARIAATTHGRSARRTSYSASGTTLARGPSGSGSRGMAAITQHTGTRFRD